MFKFFTKTKFFEQFCWLTWHKYNSYVENEHTHVITTNVVYVIMSILHSLNEMIVIWKKENGKFINR